MTLLVCARPQGYLTDAGQLVLAAADRVMSRTGRPAMKYSHYRNTPIHLSNMTDFA
jgi:hypothetical protein